MAVSAVGSESPPDRIVGDREIDTSNTFFELQTQSKMASSVLPRSHRPRSTRTAAVPLSRKTRLSSVVNVRSRS
jgi:hypothetical protein